MKKKILAAIICFTVVLSVVSSLFLIVGGSEGSGEEAESYPATTESSIFPDSTLSWQSYNDYLVEQGETAMEDPKEYVGREASFMPSWDSMYCTAGFGAGQSYKYVNIHSTNPDDPNGINSDGLDRKSVV